MKTLLTWLSGFITIGILAVLGLGTMMVLLALFFASLGAWITSI